jgi:hypothetical protein
LEIATAAVVDVQSSFPTTPLSVEKIARDFLLLSKRKRVIIPVGNLKVDSP